MVKMRLTQGVAILMQIGLNAKKLLILAILFAALLAPMAVYAQEATPIGETPAAAEGPPPGLATGVLLIGLAAVITVGVGSTILARGKPNRDSGT